MKIAIGQIKGFLGDFSESEKKILNLIERARGQADLLVLPEGGVFGYPPTDFIKQPRFLKKQSRILKKIQKNLPQSLKLLIGVFSVTENGLENGASLLGSSTSPPVVFSKRFLSNEDVFCESRYFNPGEISNKFFLLKEKRVQVLICEDMWSNPFFDSSPDILICLNSSPYTGEKHQQRLKCFKSLVKKHKTPGVYVNKVGGQGELIYDGGSFCLNTRGEVALQCTFFNEDFQIWDLKKTKTKTSVPSLPEQREKALIMGIQDFCDQTGFSKVHLGLSGGLDSALVCYLAVQAFGSKNVTALFLPGPYTASKSFQIVKGLQNKLKFSLQEFSISSLYKESLQTFFPSKPPLSLTAQNLQARLRMLWLMAYSNENQSLLLGTGNKSELACGYATLYGDLSGGLLPIGDLFKTEVYELCRAINKRSPVFSNELLARAPSAELAPNQTDQQDLPDYKKLDLILKHLMNHNPPRSSLEKQIERKLRQSEFKRKQSAPVLKVSEIAFGAGWKFPIAHKFN